MSASAKVDRVAVMRTSGICARSTARTFARADSSAPTRQATRWSLACTSRTMRGFPAMVARPSMTDRALVSFGDR